MRDLAFSSFMTTFTSIALSNQCIDCCARLPKPILQKVKRAPTRSNEAQQAQASGGTHCCYNSSFAALPGCAQARLSLSKEVSASPQTSERHRGGTSLQREMPTRCNFQAYYNESAHNKTMHNRCQKKCTCS